MTDETAVEEQTETASEFLNEPANKVMIGPHPLGGLKIAVWDREHSTYAEQRIDIDEAVILNAHLGALVTMAFQTAYAQQAQMEQQARKVFVPGRE